MRALRIAFAWLLVGVPLAWGVFQTVRKARPLFSQTSPAASVPSISVPQTNPSTPARP